MDYCRGKNKVTEVVGNFRDMEEEFGGAAGEVAEELLERAEEASLEFVKEFSGIVAEEIAENVFPAVLIVKLFKYGLGDLCPCCEPCDGSGKSGDVKCGTCRGDGIQEPFPELRSGSL